MRKRQFKQGESLKVSPGHKSLAHPAQKIREAGVLTSAGIEQGHSHSEIPRDRRKNFASFGSE